MTERTVDALEDAFDRIRGLEETIAAQAQRLADLAKLRDAAFKARVRVAADHATERDRRQKLEADVQATRLLVIDLLGLVLLQSDGAPVNAAELHGAVEQANAWLEEHGGGR